MGTLTDTNSSDLWDMMSVWNTSASSEVFRVPTGQRYCHQLLISRNAPEKFAVPMYGYVQPLIVAITLVTNSFVVYVLSRKHLRTPTNNVLLTMAIAELFTGLSSSPWMIYYYTLGGYMVERTSGISAFWCKYHRIFAVTLPTMFHNAAIFLTVYLAIQRYIYVCAPRQVPKYCTTSKTRSGILLLCVVSVVAEIPSHFSQYYFSSPNLSANMTTDGTLPLLCTSCFSEWATDVGLNNLFAGIFWTKAIVVHLFSCCILVFVTIMLMLTLRKADRKRSKHILKKQPFQSKNSTQSRLSNSNLPEMASSILAMIRLRNRPPPVRSLHATTRMLLVVIAIFLIIEVPVAVMFVVHVLIITSGLFQETAYAWIRFINVAMVFRNVLIITTYPFNFAIYCGMSAQFRTTVRQMFCGPAPTDEVVAAEEITRNGISNNTRHHRLSNTTLPRAPKPSAAAGTGVLAGQPTCNSSPSLLVAGRVQHAERRLLSVDAVPKRTMVHSPQRTVLCDDRSPLTKPVRPTSLLPVKDGGNEIQLISCKKESEQNDVFL